MRMLSLDLLQGSCLEVHAYSTCKCALCVGGMQFRVTWAGGLKDFLVGELLHKLWVKAQRKQQAQELGAGNAGQCLTPGGQATGFRPQRDSLAVDTAMSSEIDLCSSNKQGCLRRVAPRFRAALKPVQMCWAPS